MKLTRMDQNMNVAVTFSFSGVTLVMSKLRKKCPYSELFWSAFTRIRTECGKIRSISPYSVQIRENADQNNSEYGQFSRSSKHSNQQNLEKRQIKELYK